MAFLVKQEQGVGDSGHRAERCDPYKPVGAYHLTSNQPGDLQEWTRLPNLDDFISKFHLMSISFIAW